MRFINKHALVFFFLFFLITPNMCYSQVGAIGKAAAKGATKKAAKASVKAATQASVKGATKTAVKGAAKNEIKAVTKQTVKKEITKSTTNIAKSGAKNLTKNEIKQETQKALEHGTARSSREVSEAIIKKEARKTAQTSLVSSSITKTEKTILKNGGKTSVKKGAKSATIKTINKASAQESKAIMNSAVKSETKAISGIKDMGVAQRVAAKNLPKRATSESVEKALNKTAANRWEMLVKNDPHSTSVLLKDLEANPHLAKSFKQNPALLDVYHRNIGSPTYRTDLNMLRYQSFGANKFSEELVFRNKATKQLERYTGDNIKIVEQRGVNYIKDTKTDKILGTISGTAENRVIHVEPGDKTLLNLYPPGNSSIILDNGFAKTTYKTDKQGFVYECSTHFYNNIPDGIGKNTNKSKIKRIRDIKNDYNSLGQKSSRNHNLNDDGGHIVPKSMGGTDDAINIIPQNSSMNRSGVWKKSELEAINARKNGCDVERTVYFFKDNKASLRPSKVHVVQKIDGKTTVDQILDNPRVLKSNSH